MTRPMMCPNPACNKPLESSTLPSRFRCPHCGLLLQLRMTEQGITLQTAQPGDSSSSEVQILAALATPEQKTDKAAPSAAATPLWLFVVVGVVIFAIFAAIAALV